VKFWYEADIYECVLCGKTRVHRERKYTPRPELWSERNHFVQDACGSHFS
jgi:hypothetical protein